MRAYEYRTRPYHHQTTAIHKSYGQEGYAFLMEMGTGKTKVMIDEIGLKYTDEKIDAAVIVAPKGVYANWSSREIPTHLGEPAASRAMIYLWDNYRNSRSEWEAKRLLEWEGLAILVINIEAISSSTKAQKYLEKFLAKRRVYMAVDESTTIKNPTAMRTKILTKMGLRALYRRIATGSPVTRSPLDFFAQFNFVKAGSLGTSNWFAFRNRYGVIQSKVFGGRSVQVVSGYQNLDELTERVGRLSYRVLKEECLDLPPKVYQRVEVELSPEQRKIYAEMRDDAFAELGENGEFVSATIVLTQLTRLHQIVCGHVKDADGFTHSIPNKRVDALMEILEERSGKTIIWANYRHNIAEITNRLAREYGEGSYAEYHGGQNLDESQEAIRRFREDPDCEFFVATQSKGGYGITLVEANFVVYFSNNYDLEKRLQSEDRTHRSGQTKSVTYVDIVAPGTVDQKIIDALRDKKNIADLVTGDGAREWLS